MSLVTHIAYIKNIMFQVFNTQNLFNFISSIVKTESSFTDYFLSTIVSKGKTSLIFLQGDKICSISCHVTRASTINNPLIFTLLSMKCFLHEHGFIFSLFLISFHDCWAFLSMNFLEVTSTKFRYMPKIIVVIAYDVTVQQRGKIIIIYS
jgi:hypothetical protein